MMKIKIKDTQERSFARTTQGTGQASKTEKEQTFWQEENVHQVWGKYDDAKISQESSEVEKKEVYWGTMSIWKELYFWFWSRIYGQ